MLNASKLTKGIPDKNIFVVGHLNFKAKREVYQKKSLQFYKTPFVGVFFSLLSIIREKVKKYKIKKAVSNYKKCLLNSQDDELRDYGHSLIYFLQAARNFWAYAYDPAEKMLITITTRNPKNHKYPEGKPPFVLVYPIGKSPQKLAEWCHKLALELLKTSNEKVILKKVPIKHIEEYKLRGFVEYHAGDMWGEYELDDDTHPELLVSLKKVELNENEKVELKRLFQHSNKSLIDLVKFDRGEYNFRLFFKWCEVELSKAENTELSEEYKRKYKFIKGLPGFDINELLNFDKGTYTLRRGIRLFFKWLVQENCYFKFDSYDPNTDKDAVQRMIEQWADFRQKRHPTEKKEDLIDSHKCFLEGLANLPNSSSPRCRSFVMRVIKNDVDVKTGKVVGFGFFDAISASTIGIYAELALHQFAKFEKCKWETINENGVPGCSEVLIAWMLNTAREQNYTFANFGGSESDELIINRKQKFSIAKEDENKMTHLVLYKS